MTTSSINHRRAPYAAAATGLVGTLLAITLNSAYAMPGRDDRPTGPDRHRPHPRPLRRARLLHHTPHLERSPRRTPAPLLHLRPLIGHRSRRPDPHRVVLRPRAPTTSADDLSIQIGAVRGRRTGVCRGGRVGAPCSNGGNTLTA